MYSRIWDFGHIAQSRDERVWVCGDDWQALHKDGVAFARSSSKVVCDGFSQVRSISTRLDSWEGKKWAGEDRVRETGGCMKSIKVDLCRGKVEGCRMGRGWRWGQMVFKHPQCWESWGMCQKINRERIRVQLLPWYIPLPSGVWQHPIAPFWSGYTIWTAGQSDYSSRHARVNTQVCATILVRTLQWFPGTG